MKKAQMKIQQMAFMLIAVTLFFALAGLFLITFVFSGLKDSAALLEEQNALSLVSKLANSPEFSCEQAFGTNNIKCIDGDKVMALKDSVLRYSGFWGVDGIVIKKIYPKDSTICTSENYPNCGEINIVSAESGTGVSNFAILCRKAKDEYKIYNKCELAEVIVTYES